jgi:hypothetical protein
VICVNLRQLFANKKERIEKFGEDKNVSPPNLSILSANFCLSLGLGRQPDAVEQFAEARILAQAVKHRRDF